MKRIVLASMVAMAAVTSLSAQQLGWSYGVKAGANFATVVGDDVDDASMRTGFVVGAFAENRMTDLFGVSAELLYSQQGTKTSLSEDGVAVDLTAKFDYINIPILANLYVAKGLTLKAGIQPAFKINAEAEMKAKYQGQTESISSDMDNVNTFDFAIPVGLSYQFDFGLLIDARYNISATNVFKSEGGESVSARNSVIQVTAGWRF